MIVLWVALAGGVGAVARFVLDGLVRSRVERDRDAMEEQLQRFLICRRRHAIGRGLGNVHCWQEPAEGALSELFV